jgi:hypothetical protein
VEAAPAGPVSPIRVGLNRAGLAWRVSRRALRRIKTRVREPEGALAGSVRPRPVRGVDPRAHPGRHLPPSGFAVTRREPSATWDQSGTPLRSILHFASTTGSRPLSGTNSHDKTFSAMCDFFTAVRASLGFAKEVTTAVSQLRRVAELVQSIKNTDRRVGFDWSNFLFSNLTTRESGGHSGNLDGLEAASQPQPFAPTAAKAIQRTRAPAYGATTPSSTATRLGSSGPGLSSREGSLSRLARILSRRGRPDLCPFVSAP